MPSRNARCALVATLCLAALLCNPASGDAQGNLEHARLMYNAGEFDEAIAAAEPLRLLQPTASSAGLIIARARLERFRRRGDVADIEQARAELVALNLRDLSAQELIEWQIGVGASLFFQRQFGPAAEWLRAMIPSARSQLASFELEKLLEWWAASTLQVAETLTGASRIDKYRELLRAMESEQQADPWSRAATYWVMVASRGIGDLDRAWDEAIAGWIRAKGLAGAADLRADIDRFVVETIIPERVQMHTGLRLDAGLTDGEVSAMTEAWKQLTQRWTGRD